MEFKQMDVMCCNLFRIWLNLRKSKPGELSKVFSNTSSAKILHITKVRQKEDEKESMEFKHIEEVE